MDMEEALRFRCVVFRFLFIGMSGVWSTSDVHQKRFHTD